MRYEPAWLFVLGASIAMLTIAGCDASDGRVSPAASLSAGPARVGQGGPRHKSGLARVALDSPGKPQAPIEFDYELLGTAALGQPLAIWIDARARDEGAEVDITLGGSGPLWTGTEAAGVRIESARNKARSGQTIEVVPLASGPVQLNVLLQAVIDGRLQSRVVAIPIQVGSIGTATTFQSAVSTDASGQLIVALPATSP